MSDETLNESVEQVTENIETEATETPQSLEMQELVSKAQVAEDKATNATKQNKLYADHIALLEANKPQPQEEAYEDDTQKIQKELAKMKIKLAEANAVAEHKDFKKVIKKYLPKAIEENPSIMAVLQALPEDSDQVHEMAYLLATKSDAYLMNQAMNNRTDDAKKITINSQKAPNLSSIGKSPSTASEPDWKNMDEKEFNEHMTKNLGLN